MYRDNTPSSFADYAKKYAWAIILGGMLLILFGFGTPANRNAANSGTTTDTTTAETITFDGGIFESTANEVQGQMAGWFNSVTMSTYNCPNSDIASAHLYEGVAQYQLANMIQAATEFGNAIAIDPACYHAHMGRGVSRAWMEHWDMAVTDFTEAISLQPDQYNPYIGRTLSYMFMDDYTSALTDANVAVDLAPPALQSYTYGIRGSIYDHLEAYPRSIADYEEAIRLDPQNAYMYWGIGNVYTYTGDYDAAVNAYQQYAEITGELEPFMQEFIAWAQSQ